MKAFKQGWFLLALIVGFVLYELYVSGVFDGGRVVNMIFACPDGQGGRCWRKEGEIIDNQIEGFYTEAGKLVTLSCDQLRTRYGRAVNEYQCDDENGNIWMVYRGDSFVRR